MSAMRKPTNIILLALACVVTVSDIAAAQKSELKFRVPPGWVAQERTSSMRVAQYKLARATVSFAAEGRRASLATLGDETGQL